MKCYNSLRTDLTEQFVLSENLSSNTVMSVAALLAFVWLHAHGAKKYITAAMPVSLRPGMIGTRMSASELKVMKWIISKLTF